MHSLSLSVSYAIVLPEVLTLYFLHMPTPSKLWLSDLQCGRNKKCLSCPPRILITDSNPLCTSFSQWKSVRSSLFTCTGLLPHLLSFQHVRMNHEDQPVLHCFLLFRITARRSLNKLKSALQKFTDVILHI